MQWDNLPIKRKMFSMLGVSLKSIGSGALEGSGMEKPGKRKKKTGRRGWELKGNHEMPANPRWPSTRGGEFLFSKVRDYYPDT